MEDNLYDIRCPNITWKGNTYGLHCKSLCVRMSAKSMGEVACRKCKVLFNFIVNEDGLVTYKDIKPKMKGDVPQYKNPRKPKTAEDRFFAMLNAIDE